MKGTIIIEGLRVFSHIGVLPQEKTVGNTYEADVRLIFDCTKVIEEGGLDNTINYAGVTKLVRDEIQKPAELLEDTVGRIISAIRKEYPQVTGGEIALYKVHPPIPAELGRVGFICSF